MRSAALGRVGRMPFVPLAIAAAWLIAIVTQLTGSAALLHHHALIEGGPPLWVAIPLFLLGWQVMLAAMMLPASLPTLHLVGAVSDASARSQRGRATFLVAFAAVWSVFGLFAFMGDFVLHHIVDVTPWLAARPWLIEGGVLTLAGSYQLSPLKRHSLAACRHPADLLMAATTARRSSPFEMGVIHGLVCLGSSWALMLLMFAEGFANLWWMAALTVVMVYEATRRRGQQAAVAVGAVLLGLSVATIAIGWGAL